MAQATPQRIWEQACALEVSSISLFKQLFDVQSKILPQIIKLKTANMTNDAT